MCYDALGPKKKDEKLHFLTKLSQFPSQGILKNPVKGDENSVKILGLVAASQTRHVCDLVCHCCKLLGFPAKNDL